MGMIGPALSAFGQIESGSAQNAAYQYNARVAAENAQSAKMNAQMAGEAGAAQAEAKSMGNKSTYGQIKANQGSSGLDLNATGGMQGGNPVAVRQSAKELGILDTQTIRSNAARTAYGYQVQQTNFLAQSKLDRFEGDQASEAGWIEGAGTLIGGAEDQYSQYLKFASMGG